MRVLRLALALAVLLAGCSGQQPAAAPTSSPDVGVTTMDLSLSTLVYTPPGSGKHPVVLFIHGFTRRPEDHDRLFRAWANAGFVVIAPVMAKTARGTAEVAEDLINQPTAASKVLTEALAKLGDSADSDHIAAAGHSLGGMTVVGLFTKFRDPRLKGGIVMAGNDWLVGHEYSGAPVPLFFIHAKADDVVTFDSGMATYNPLTWPKMFLALDKGDHLTPYLGESVPEYRTVESSTVDYLKWILAGDSTAHDHLLTVAGLTEKK